LAGSDYSALLLAQQQVREFHAKTIAITVVGGGTGYR